MIRPSRRRLAVAGEGATPAARDGATRCCGAAAVTSCEGPRPASVPPSNATRPADAQLLRLIALPPDLRPVSPHRVRFALDDSAHVRPVRAHHQDVSAVEGWSVQLVAGEDDPVAVGGVRREGGAPAAGHVSESAQLRAVSTHGEHVTGRPAAVAAEYQVRAVR